MYDAIIVGGGVIGLSIAWELSRRGQCCAVVEARQIGGGSSWAGAGILPPARRDTARDPIDQLRGISHALHPEWAAQLRETTGIDTGFRRCGGYYLARTAGEAAALQGLASYWNEYAITAERIDAAELSQRQGALAELAESSTLRGAWWVPEECQLRPPDHLRALRQACEQTGVRMLERSPVDRLDVVEGRVTGIYCGAQQLSADSVVLCCGAWASQFPDPAGALPNVYPVRGQVALLRGPVGLLDAVINEGNRYLVPRDDGHIYVGSNEEEVGLVEGTTAEVIDSLRQWAGELVPALRACPVVRTWSGFRPASFDGFPYIGRSPHVKNLYLATGHYRSGLHLSCGTAVVIADLITGRSPDRDLASEMDVDPFRVGR